MKHAAILLLLVACKTSHAVEVEEAIKLSDVEHAEASGEKHEGPWTVTTTTEEYANVDIPVGAGDRSGSWGGGDAPPDQVGSVGGVPIAHPAVIRRTITVEEHGPIDESWRSSSDGLLGAEETMKGKADDKSEPDAGCAFSGGLWLALVGVGLAGLIWFRRAALLAVCKRLVGIGAVLAVVAMPAAGQTVQPQRPGTSAPMALPVQGVTSGVPVKITCPDGTCSGGAGGGLTDTQLRATPVPVSGSGTFDISDRVGRALGSVTIGAGSATIGKVDQGTAGASAWLVTGAGGTFPISGSISNTSFGATQGTSPWVTADNHTTAAAPLSCRASDGAAFYDSRQIRALTVADVVGLGAGSAVIGHVIHDTGSTTVVTGNVTVVQPTGTNLHAVLDATSTTACTQATGTNLHAVLDATSTTAVTQATAANLNATVVLAAGTALAGKVGIDQTTPGTTNGVVALPTTAAAGALSQKVFTANTALNVKASAGNVYGWSVVNAAAAVCWLQFYNTAGTPTCGTAVIWSVPLPVTPGVSNFVPATLALQNHATGIGICVSTTATGGTTCGSTASGTVFFQ